MKDGDIIQIAHVVRDIDRSMKMRLLRSSRKKLDSSGIVPSH